MTKEEIRSTYTDELASQRVGYQVKAGLVSDLEGIARDRWPDALLLRPADYTAILDKSKSAYVYRLLTADTDVEAAFSEMCDVWVKDCLPNLRPPAEA